MCYSVFLVASKREWSKKEMKRYWIALIISGKAIAAGSEKWPWTKKPRQPEAKSCLARVWWGWHCSHGWTVDPAGDSSTTANTGCEAAALETSPLPLLDSRCHGSHGPNESSLSVTVNSNIKAGMDFSSLSLGPTFQLPRARGKCVSALSGLLVLSSSPYH